MADPELRSKRAEQLSFIHGSLFLEEVRVTTKSRDGYASRFPHLAALTKVARLLEKGQTAEAIFLANFCLKGVHELRKANFDEAEARDFKGEWVKTENPMRHRILRTYNIVDIFMILLSTT